MLLEEVIKILNLLVRHPESQALILISAGLELSESIRLLASYRSNSEDTRTLGVDDWDTNMLDEVIGLLFREQRGYEVVMDMNFIEYPQVIRMEYGYHVGNFICLDPQNIFYLDYMDDRNRKYLTMRINEEQFLTSISDMSSENWETRRESVRNFLGYDEDDRNQLDEEDDPYEIIIYSTYLSPDFNVAARIVELMYQGCIKFPDYLGARRGLNDPSLIEFVNSLREYPNDSHPAEIMNVVNTGRGTEQSTYLVSYLKNRVEYICTQLVNLLRSDQLLV